MHHVRETTQISDRAFTLPALSTFISLVSRALIALVLAPFIALVLSGMYVHIFHAFINMHATLLRNF